MNSLEQQVKLFEVQSRLIWELVSVVQSEYGQPDCDAANGNGKVRPWPKLVFNLEGESSKQTPVRDITYKMA